MANDFEERALKAEKENLKLKEKLQEVRQELATIREYLSLSKQEVEQLNDPAFIRGITEQYERRNQITPAPAHEREQDDTVVNVEPAVAPGGTPKGDETVSVPAKSKEPVEDENRKKMDEYGVKLLSWANIGLDDGNGSTVTTAIQGIGKVTDNKLGAGEIARVFGKNVKDGEKHRGYLVQGFDTDGDGKLSSTELDRMEKIAKEAGLHIDKAALGKVMDVKGPEKSPIATPVNPNPVAKNIPGY